MMDGFVKHIILRDNITEETINNKKEIFDCKNNDVNIKYKELEK